MPKRTLAVVTALSLACALSSTAALSMRLTDLTKVDVSAFPTPDYTIKQAPDRLTIACVKCDGLVAIDVTISPTMDGTEERIRNGETTAKTMLEICKKNAKARGTECYNIRTANLKGAVGFVSDYKISDAMYGATYTIFQDNKLLMMRNIAGSRAEAKRLGGLAFEHVAPQIVR